MTSIRQPQNPGLGGLSELTSSEILLVQQLNGLGDPGADRILFWDESANAFAYLTAGTGLTITGTTITATGAVDGSGTTNEITYWVDSDTLGALAVATYPSLTELSYVKGVTSAIQTQISAKAPSTATTFATSITGSYLTASEILGTGASKEIVSLPVATYPSLTELSYVKGLTSAVQTQITAKMTNPMTTGGDVIYGGASGVPTRLANGSAGQVLTSGGTTVAPTWTTGGVGDVVKVGTPVNNQVGVWTGDGTLEGDAALTYDATTDTLTSVTFAGNLTGNASGTAATVTGAAQTAITSVGTLTALQVDNLNLNGNTIISSDTNGNINLTPNGSGLNVLANAQITGLTASEIVITDASKNLASAAVATYPSLTELTYVKGVTSAIQTQLGTKAPSTAPTFATSVTGSYLTASEMLGTGASKEIVSLGVATYPSLTELTYVKGLTSSAQTQITAKAPSASPTFTGAVTISEDASIRLDRAALADGQYVGTTIEGTAGATLAFGDIIYFAVADSRWELADATAAATGVGMIGICVLAAAADASATRILLQGFINAATVFPALTVGAPVYLDDVAGDVSVAIPTGADTVIRVLGFAMTGDEMYWNPSPDHQITVA